MIKLSSPETQEFWEIPIRYEDEHLLALDKPGGMLASPDRLEPARPSLLGLLHAGIAQGKPWAISRSLHWLMNVHRLEADASGLCLFAKSKPVFAALADYFGSDNNAKNFLALVQGQPAEDTFEVDSKLGPDPARPGAMRLEGKLGKRARTRFTVVERFERYSLVQGALLTDRPHQIRLHLRQARLPVVGDALYGGKPLLLSRLKPGYRLKKLQVERPLLARAAVHSERLAFPHPVTAEAVNITAPWPKDLMVAVKYLRRYGRLAAASPEAFDPSPEGVGQGNCS